MGCDGHKVNATLAILEKVLGPEAGRGLSDWRDSCSWLANHTLTITESPDLPHYHCPSHCMRILLTTLKCQGFERTWDKSQGQGSSLPIQLSFWISAVWLSDIGQVSSPFWTSVPSPVRWRWHYGRMKGNNFCTGQGQPSITLRSLPSNF